MHRMLRLLLTSRLVHGAIDHGSWQALLLEQLAKELHVVLGGHKPSRLVIEHGKIWEVLEEKTTGVLMIVDVCRCLLMFV